LAYTAATEETMEQAEKLKGIYEKPPGSGVWWIHYQIKGVRHREKAGRRSDAVSLYRKRKADGLRGIKLPELVPGNAVRFGDLARAAVAYAETHLRTAQDYRAKGLVLQETLGSRPAAEITPAEIEAVLSDHCRTNGTFNKHRSFVSLAFRLGMENGKVSSNPARLVRRRTEDNARLRYLSREEYAKVLAVIQRDHPAQGPAFVVGAFTGMRWGEQFSLTWGQVDLRRKVIRLDRTKNGSGRNVPLNSVALGALEVQRAAEPHSAGDQVFPLHSESDRCRWWFEPALREAKVDGVVWHSLRHTFCSWLALAGVGIREIQELAGHRSITTAARYAHLSPEATATASERLVM
jgi:integrase